VVRSIRSDDPLVALLREKRRAVRGSIAAFAIALLSYQPGNAERRYVLAGAWRWWSCFSGVQAYVMKLATSTMQAESIFFYMMATGLVLSPVAVAMTDFALPVNWGWNGPALAPNLAGGEMLEHEGEDGADVAGGGVRSQG
jgi:hypothetical protein